MAWAEPTPLEKLNWLIHIQHVRGETEACKELIKEEIRKSSGRNEFAYFKEGVILREEGKTQEALEAFQICHKQNSENVENVKEIAKCLYLLRRYRLALDAYLEAEKSSSKPDWEIYHNIGQCLMSLGEITKAKEYVRRAVKLGKQETSYALLIKTLATEGDLHSAVTICNTAIEACPDSINMLTESGLLYLKVGQTQHAFERLSSALALDPHHCRALLGVGCITQFHEEFDVALSKYKIAVQNEPDSVALWNNIGMCFYSKQKYIAAVSCLKRALWLSPLNWRVLFNLGLVHLSTHQPASAFNFLCAAVNLRPDSAMCFMILGCALLELKDAENALRALRQALSLSPNDPNIIMNTIFCLLSSGLQEEAVDLLQKFRVLSDQDSRISKELLAYGDRLEYSLQADSKQRISSTSGEKTDFRNKSNVEGASEKDVENTNETREENTASAQLDSNNLSSRKLGPDEV